MSWTNGTKVPGSELAGVLLIGRFAPRIESASERKGCESLFYAARAVSDTQAPFTRPQLNTIQPS